MGDRNQDRVQRVVLNALRHAFGDNADPYEDDPMRFGVCFADGSMIDVSVQSRYSAASPGGQK
jgi:hypothetical protein